MITFEGMFCITSDRPLGNFRKAKSFILFSLNSSNPIEQIAKTRLWILNLGNRLQENLYFFLVASW